MPPAEGAADGVALGGVDGLGTELGEELGTELGAVLGDELGTGLAAAATTVIVVTAFVDPLPPGGPTQADTRAEPVLAVDGTVTVSEKSPLAFVAKDGMPTDEPRNHIWPLAALAGKPQPVTWTAPPGATLVGLAAIAGVGQVGAAEVDDGLGDGEGGGAGDATVRLTLATTTAARCVFLPVRNADAAMTCVPAVAAAGTVTAALK